MQKKMTDPWLILENTSELNKSENREEQHRQTTVGNLQQNSTIPATLEFEDNFAPLGGASTQSDNKNCLLSSLDCNCVEHQPLPGSQNYLWALEHKLQKIKKGSKLIEALCEKRQESLRTLLQQDDVLSNLTQNNDEILELDRPIINAESALQEIYRQLQPVQPITVGETVHIIKYDQLEQQPKEATEETSSDEAEVHSECSH